MQDLSGARVTYHRQCFMSMVWYVLVHIAIDFNGSLKKISIMRSIGIGNEELSLPLSEVFDRKLRLRVMD